MDEGCNRLKLVCLVCFLPTELEILKAHNHCCGRIYCEDKYFEITEWEKNNLGSSLLEKLSMCY